MQTTTPSGGGAIPARPHIPKSRPRPEAVDRRYARYWREIVGPRTAALKPLARGLLDALLDHADKLRNAADAWREAVREFAGMLEAWERATEAVERDTTSRRRAEAVGQVIERVTVKFTPTGRRCPVGVLDSVEIVPRTAGGTTGGFSKCALEFPRK